LKEYSRLEHVMLRIPVIRLVYLTTLVTYDSVSRTM